MNEQLPAPGTWTDIRFAVPGHYATGPEFPTFAEAAAAATESIVEFDYTSVGMGIRHSRAFVDMRGTVGNDMGATDMVMARWEVFADRGPVLVNEHFSNL